MTAKKSIVIEGVVVILDCERWESVKLFFLNPTRAIMLDTMIESKSLTSTVLN